MTKRLLLLLLPLPSFLPVEGARCARMRGHVCPTQLQNVARRCLSPLSLSLSPLLGRSPPLRPSTAQVDFGRSSSTRFLTTLTRTPLPPPPLSCLLLLLLYGQRSKTATTQQRRERDKQDLSIISEAGFETELILLENKDVSVTARFLPICKVRMCVTYTPVGINRWSIIENDLRDSGGKW